MRWTCIQYGVYGKWCCSLSVSLLPIEIINCDEARASEMIFLTNAPVFERLFNPSSFKHRRRPAVIIITLIRALSIGNNRPERAVHSVVSLIATDLLIGRQSYWEAYYLHEYSFPKCRYSVQLPQSHRTLIVNVTIPQTHKQVIKLTSIQERKTLTFVVLNKVLTRRLVESCGYGARNCYSFIAGSIIRALTKYDIKLFRCGTAITITSGDEGCSEKK
jgi:hypothetical protein